MDTVSKQLQELFRYGFPNSIMIYGARYVKASDEVNSYHPYEWELDKLIPGVVTLRNEPETVYKEWERSMIEGMGKDAPTIQNEHGASQSESKYRFDLLDPQIMFDIARVLHEGAEKYGDTNWHDISIEDHMNHAMQHIFAFMANDYQDEHLIHAICRLMFAKFLEERN